MNIQKQSNTMSENFRNQCKLFIFSGKIFLLLTWINKFLILRLNYQKKLVSVKRDIFTIKGAIHASFGK